jgi:murein DD-endopeptidase
MPTLGKQARASWTRWVVLGVVLLGAGGGYLWRRMSRPPAAPAMIAPAPTTATTATSVTPTDAASAEKGAAAPPVAAAPPKPATDELLKKAGVRHVHVVIEGPLERALVTQVGREVGLPLAQVVVRALVWWVDVPGGLRKGDEVSLLFEEHAGEEPSVAAIRFKSGKQNKMFAAYRFKWSGAPAGRLYQPDGSELELRLENSPVDEYEQITSLLNDGRGHKGVDFKTPVGTPVKAPFEGTIVRRNWKFRDNGNSIELVEGGGQHRHAIFLHLSKLAEGGNQVSRGQVIGGSGNTGHSFAPHLHYQLMSASGLVLDPFASHATSRRSLAPAELSSFTAEMRRLDELFDLAAPARAQ